MALDRHLSGDNVSEGTFAEAGRAGEQAVIKSLGVLKLSIDRNAYLIDYAALTDEMAERGGLGFIWAHTS